MAINNTVAKKVIIYNEIKTIKTDYCVPAQAPFFAGPHARLNIRFVAMVNHQVFEHDFGNPQAGLETGQVEKNVRDSRHQMLQGMVTSVKLAQFLG